jgi:RNA-binding protein YhbY
MQFSLVLLTFISYVYNIKSLLLAKSRQFTRKSHGQLQPLRLSPLSTLFQLHDRRNHHSVLKMCVSVDTAVVNERLSGVERVLSEIIDPLSGDNLVKTKIVSNIIIDESNVSIDLLSSNMDIEVIDEIKKLCIMQLTMGLDWIKDIKFNIVSSTETSSRNILSIEDEAQKNSLDAIKNIIAVSSCKGGVGKCWRLFAGN